VDKIDMIKGFLERGRSGSYPMGFLTGFDSAEMIELGGAAGFEFIIIDQEHSLLASPKEVLPLLRAAELYGLLTIVKLNTWDPIAARDAFDAGACGVQVPFVESAEMLREVVKACRFRPLGTRGYCPVSRTTKHDFSEAGFNRYLELVNEHILIIPTIESEEGVEALDEMLTNPDCPIFAIGPEDLRMSLGVSYDKDGANYMTKVLSAIGKKIDAAGKLNMTPLFWPMPGYSREDTSKLLELHHNHLPYTLDGAALNYGYLEVMQVRQVARSRKK
jgi:2-keto-3-deoxy-L-rhamnonate aldolase RhmA